MGFLPARRGRNRNAAGYGAGAAASTWMRAVDALSGERADRGAGLTSRRITCMTTAGISSEQLPQPAQGRDDREQVRLMWLASRVGIRPVSQTHAGRVPLVPPIGGGYKAQHANDGADREDAPCSLSWGPVATPRSPLGPGRPPSGARRHADPWRRRRLHQRRRSRVERGVHQRAPARSTRPPTTKSSCTWTTSDACCGPARFDRRLASALGWEPPQPSEQQCRARPRTGLDAGADGPGGATSTGGNCLAAAPSTGQHRRRGGRLRPARQRWPGVHAKRAVWHDRPRQ